MPETFLVLGANSFYGSNFAAHVEARGDVAIRLSRPEWQMGASELPDATFDYVVNFASRSLVAESWLDPQDWMMTNVVFFTALLDQLRQRQFKKFVHVSTPEVYGHTDGWVDETYAAWKPSTPYAVSRAAGDMILTAYQRAYGLPAIITRTANIYGIGQGKNRIIPLAFEAVRSGKQILLHGGGHTIRAFIHISDACSALYMVAKQGTVGQTYHISTNSEITILSLVKRVCFLLGKRGPDFIGSQPDRLGKDQAYLLKSERIRKMGWRDKITLEKGLKEYGNIP